MGVEQLKNILNSFSEHIYINENAGGEPDLKFIERLIDVEFLEMDLNPLIIQEYLYFNSYQLDQSENLNRLLLHPQVKDYFNFLKSFPVLDSSIIILKRKMDIVGELQYDIIEDI